MTMDATNLTGRVLGNVTLIRELGRGGTGVVYVGFQNTLKRQVAVKLLPKARLREAAASGKFQEEAETVAVLTHPNIVPIFEMGETEDLYYQVMQLVAGSDLGGLIDKKSKHPVPGKRLLPLVRTLDIMIQVLDGLAYAHEEGVVHQDMKPGNILVEERSGRPLIADFGIAKTAYDEYGSKGVILGTPLYLAPEQAAAAVGAGETDQRSDIYSMGVILFRMVCGNVPRHKENVKALLRRKIYEPDTVFTATPSAVSPLVDDRLEHIILKATASKPIARYQNSSSFRADLVSYKEQLSS